MESRDPGVKEGNRFMRSRLVGLLLVVGLLGGGAGALAASGGLPVNAFSNGQGSANSQYCPPTSQNPGAPKQPGTNCGNPKTKKHKHKNTKAKSCRKHKTKHKAKHHARKSADAFADKKKKRHSKSCSRGHGKSKSKAHGKGHGKKK
jgi:hypothetical protein